jgi:hypothetical protein
MKLKPETEEKTNPEMERKTKSDSSSIFEPKKCRNAFVKAKD